MTYTFVLSCTADAWCNNAVWQSYTILDPVDVGRILLWQRCTILDPVDVGRILLWQRCTILDPVDVGRKLLTFRFQCKLDHCGLRIKVPCYSVSGGDSSVTYPDSQVASENPWPVSKLYKIPGDETNLRLRPQLAQFFHHRPAVKMNHN